MLFELLVQYQVIYHIFRDGNNVAIFENFHDLQSYFLVSDFAADCCVQHYHSTEKQFCKHGNEVISHLTSPLSFQVSGSEEKISKQNNHLALCKADMFHSVIYATLSITNSSLKFNFKTVPYLYILPIYLKY